MKTPGYLNSLRAFEASARHLSFSGAAAELNVTPAAVGQLVRGLEEWLGFPLFHRSSSGKSRLMLSEQANVALPIIQEGFEKLSLGLASLKEGSLSGILTVTVSPAFAAKWLLPRIDRFQAMCPTTDVRLDTNLKPVDFVANNIDIGVRYGRGHWPGLLAEKLMEEEVFPVCSPTLLDKHPELLQNPAEIALQTLIHDLSVDKHLGFTTWGDWFERQKINWPEHTRGLQINSSAAVLQAAIDGHGIALARSVMAHDDIVSKRLVRLVPQIACNAELAYYIVYRSDWAKLPRLLAFKQWLVNEATSTLKANES